MAPLSCVVFFLFLLSTVHAVCPDAWTKYDDYCFALIKEKNTWRNAGVFCREFGGHLATPNSTTKIENTKKFIRYMNHKANVWLGASDMALPGLWSWDRDQKSVTVTDWGLHQPDGTAGENCLGLTLKDDFKWHDLPCDKEFDFLCERRSITQA